MSNEKRPALQLLASFVCLVAFYGCLQTGAKNVSKRSTSTDTSTNAVDSFSVTLAYLPTSSRVVQLQGVRDLPSASLTIPCGANGTACYCKFYTSTSDSNPVGSSGVGISSGVNSFSCTIAGSVTPSNYKYVRLFNTGNTKATGFINISNSLTITDVLGGLDQKKVRGIFRYTCNRTFFEGEGVSATEVACPALQKLGIISAPYSFYLYNSYTATNNQPPGNLGDKSSGMVFDKLICARQFTKTICNTSPELRYGLYGEQNTLFSVGITMTSIPDAPTGTASGTNTNTNVQVGYAALPDTAGNCPTGLVKVRPWVAQPASIIQGSIDGTNPPSNFLNQGNSLNNTQVEADQPSAFQVSRQSNATRCRDTSTDQNDPTGSCVAASFNGISIVQTVAYRELSPVVCAIPSNLLSGVIP
jgi:hypothetical protein